MDLIILFNYIMKSLKLNLLNNKNGKSWSIPPSPKKNKFCYLDKSPIIKHIEREIIRKHGDNKFPDEEFEQFCLTKK